MTQPFDISHLTSPLLPSLPRRGWERWKALYFSSILVISGALFAQNQIEVIKGAERISIALPPLGGAAGNDATAILTRDLERSGWFRVVASGGDYSVQGSA